MEKSNFELVVAIINEGFSDLVMNAAIEEGARGGTILHARGTGNKSMEKKYGIAITPNKETVLILVNSSITDKVMSAVNKACGIETECQGFIFSVPVNDISGLKYEETPKQ